MRTGLIGEVQGNSLEARHHLRKAQEKTEEEDMPLELIGHICLLSGQMQFDEGITGPVRDVLDHARRCFEYEGDLAMTLKATSVRLFIPDSMVIASLPKVSQQLWTATERDICEDDQIARKQAELKEAIQEALARDAHKTILKWDLAT